MGEISRCGNCNTLTNSAAYDWVLSEITQAEDYRGGVGLSADPTLKQIMKNDSFFAARRMEDIASNIFMQVMEVLTGNDTKRLSRFADGQVTDTIIKQKQSTRPFLFDRLYLNDVTLARYTVEDNLAILFFEVTVTYRRVSINGGLLILDPDFVTSHCRLELSRHVNAPGKTAKGEFVYSYECSSCGAPYTDTTEDRCGYCDALVVDKDRNWVLTGFNWE